MTVGSLMAGSRAILLTNSIEDSMVAEEVGVNGASQHTLVFEDMSRLFAGLKFLLADSAEQILGESLRKLSSFSNFGLSYIAAAFRLDKVCFNLGTYNRYKIKRSTLLQFPKILGRVIRELAIQTQKIETRKCKTGLPGPGVLVGTWLGYTEKTF
jgi:hypothetical protein